MPYIKHACQICVCVRASVHACVCVCVCLCVEMFVLKPGRHVIMPDKVGTQQKLTAMLTTWVASGDSPQRQTFLWEIWCMWPSHVSYAFVLDRQTGGRQSRLHRSQKKANFLWHVLPLQVLLYICDMFMRVRYIHSGKLSFCDMCHVLLSHLSFAFVLDRQTQTTGDYSPNGSPLKQTFLCHIWYVLPYHDLTCFCARQANNHRQQWTAAHQMLPLRHLTCASSSSATTSTTLLFSLLQVKCLCAW